MYYKKQTKTIINLIPHIMKTTTIQNATKLKVNFKAIAFLFFAVALFGLFAYMSATYGFSDF